jgi:hypothetical protein
MKRYSLRAYYWGSRAAVTDIPFVHNRHVKALGDLRRFSRFQDRRKPFLLNEDHRAQSCRPGLRLHLRLTGVSAKLNTTT